MHEFEYLDCLVFETELDEKEIREKISVQLKNGEIDKESIEWGKKFENEIKEHHLANVSLRLISNEVGHGIFAEEVISEKAFVGEYVGVVRKNDFRRYVEPTNDYLYQYPVLSEDGMHFVIDATKGNLTRFINHSYTPNLDKKFILYQGIYHVIFLSNRIIEKGEQLTINYGKNYWYTREAPVSF
jgi:hypothetical protein